MFDRFTASLFVCLISVMPAVAGENATPSEDAPQSKRIILGNGRLLQNDFFGDGHDRWQSGSYAMSIASGYGWNGSLPSTPGEFLEYRFLAQTIQPANISTPAASDRRYASAFTAGVHTHFETARGTEMSIGADMVIIGPQTGLHHIQSAVHDVLSMPKVSDAVLAAQIGNKVRPSVTFEAGRNIDFGESSRFRPFVEMRAGVETYARVGFDLIFGPVTQGDMMVRDSITGQRYRTVRVSPEGVSFVLGADIAKVWDSTFLPEDEGYVLTDSRNRVRAGVNWQGKKWSVYYGLTWLGEEFVAQPEGQLTGAININVKF